ncbi:Uncharacterised protein [Streptococcus pneumoniae]|nr:Uncharacterised protein [Streptococcus pneumoniae]
MFVLLNAGGACLLSDNPNNILLFEKIPLLHDDAAAVNTTKLIKPAANGIPISVNNLTNGLLSGSTLSQGMIDMITARAPT